MRTQHTNSVGIFFFVAEKAVLPTKTIPMVYVGCQNRLLSTQNYERSNLYARIKRRTNQRNFP